MCEEEITIEELLAGESNGGAPPTSFRQLLVNGFPPQCGLEGLAWISSAP